MRLILVLGILAAMVLGCGRFGAGSGPVSNSSANTNTSTTKVAKIVDLSQLVGKTVAEMNTILGQGKVDSTSATYDIPQGFIIASFSKDKKVDSLTFSLNSSTADSTPIKGYQFAEELGQATGLAISGTPTSTTTYEDKYDEFMLNGKKCELTVKKIAGSYRGARLYCP